MNLRRIVANAVARRVAVLLVAAVFAWMGLGTARAAAVCTNVGAGCDFGTAYAACMADAAAPLSHEPKPQGCNQPVGSTPSSGQWRRHPVASPSAGVQYYFYTSGCAARADEYTWQSPVAGGTQNRCADGCMYSFIFDVSGNFYAPTGAGCTVADAPAPAIDTDGDGVPDDLDAFPLDPNESVDTDGDGIGDNADIAPDDPTNGEDEGDGDETDNTATGGGDCGAPPACKGDGIQCNTNFQVWKLRCQGTAHGSVTGNVLDCNQSVVVASPDPIANAQLLTLRKIACKDGDGGTGTGDGFGTGDSDNLGTIADAVRGEGEPDNGIGPEEPGDAWYGEGEETPTSFDDSGYGFGSSCPEIPSIDVFGTSIAFDIEPLCNWATLGGYIVIALAGLACVRIISGRAA